MSFSRPVNLGPGFAPDVAIVDGHVYVAFGVESPSSLLVVVLDTIGNEITRHTLPDGFFDSFPRFDGAWLAYKRGDPSYGPMLTNVVTGMVETYPGVAAGNYGLAVNAKLGLMAYQNGEYPIWYGTFGGEVSASAEQGAPDGLDTIISPTEVTLRKDTRNSVPRLTWPVRNRDVVVGEWALDADVYGCGVQLDGDVLRVAMRGNCPTPRCATDGTTYAFVTGGADGVRVWLGPRADVQALPVAPEKVLPIGPTTAPRAQDGRLVDLAQFVRSDPALQPRSGPTHPINQIEHPNGVFHIVKFNNPPSYEQWAFDEHWIYHMEDASSGDPYHFTNPCLWPRELAIGEPRIHGPWPTVPTMGSPAGYWSGNHDSIWTARGVCNVTKREPFARKMWLYAVYDGWYWGPDLGNRPTIILVYDDTGGFYIPGRFIELGFYADGAGGCRWEAHHAELVYQSGRPVFSDASRSARSDFYLLGGKPIQPELSGCVSQDNPHVPPLPPIPPKPTEPEMLYVWTNVNSFKADKCNKISNDNGTVSCQRVTDSLFLSRDSGGNVTWKSEAKSDEQFFQGKTKLLSDNNYPDDAHASFYGFPYEER